MTADDADADETAAAEDQDSPSPDVDPEIKRIVEMAVDATSDELLDDLRDERQRRRDLEQRVADLEQLVDGAGDADHEDESASSADAVDSEGDDHGWPRGVY